MSPKIFYSAIFRDGPPPLNNRRDLHPGPLMTNRGFFTRTFGGGPDKKKIRNGSPRISSARRQTSLLPRVLPRLRLRNDYGYMQINNNNNDDDGDIIIRLAANPGKRVIPPRFGVRACGGGAGVDCINIISFSARQRYNRISATFSPLPPPTTRAKTPEGRRSVSRY